MTQEEMDEKQEDIDPSPDESAGKNNASPDGAGSDNNADEEIKIKKSEWNKTQTVLKSVQDALRIERDKNRKKGLSSIVERDEEEETEKPAKRKTDDVRAVVREERERELRQERVGYEDAEKSNILKRFPKLAADNPYGIDEQILENYNILLEGRKARNLMPRTQADIAKLLEHAVKMSYPDLFIQEEKEKGERGEDYTGMETGMGRPPKVGAKPYTPKENQLKTLVDAMVKK